MKETYSMRVSVWLYAGKAAWHFVTLPQEIAADIDDRFVLHKRGFGSLRVTATIGSTSWQTSIFPDKKSNSYLLPIKAIVREKENISAGDTVSISLELVD